MGEIISYKMCAVKVRNAKLRNYLNTRHVIRLDELGQRKDSLTDNLSVLSAANRRILCQDKLYV
jgi:hypothetical protein